MSKNTNTKTKKVSIGGQAVMEGVMMRGESSMAIAVRDSDGIIRLETKKVKPASKRNFFLRLPIIRGVYSFIQSMVDGVGILMRSADVYGEGEPSKFEKWVANKLKVNVMSIVTTFAMVLALCLAVFLFIFLPQAGRKLIEAIFSTKFSPWIKNLIEGLLKITVFVCYILLCSLIKDVKRTFMYHGAEHKTISCYESGLELSVQNAKKCSRVHDRCGTTFIVFVMIISIICFAIFESLVGVEIDKFLRIGCKVLMLPLVAGLSYELLKGLAKTNCFIFYPFKLPGLLLQRLTTKEPDDKMLEVAICAFNTVMQMDADPTIKEVKFEMPISRKQLTEKVIDILSKNDVNERSEAEWIVSICLNVKRSQVYTEDYVSIEKQRQIYKVVNERITGRPLWYCLGDTEFYGYKIKVDERCLIPRPETELLAEEVIKNCNVNTAVLDLCTGSGAIAIAVKKESGAIVTAIDVSKYALDIAKENANLNSAEIEFIESDLFEGVSEGVNRKFDIIVSNPPYIKSEEISSLQNEVKNFEPMNALDGGKDGLHFYRIICKHAKNHLNDNGILLLECGYNQAQEIAKMLDGFKKIEIIKDYENIDRIIKAVL